MSAGLEIRDANGNVIYDTFEMSSYYKIGEFEIDMNIYPSGSSEGYGNVFVMLSDNNIKIGKTFLTKKSNLLFLGYSYGHYPSHEADGDGYIEILINNGSITAQFKRYPANGTMGYYYLLSGGTYEVWGIRNE